jgi:hypothetical protein
MGEDTGAPAERHPIEPPDFRRHREVDEQEQQDHRHIGEEVNGEGALFAIDEDALAPPRLAQEEGKVVGGDGDAPTH